MKPSKDITGIILAAGLSSRMGDFKQLLPIGGQPAVCRIAQLLTQCLKRVIVVVGHNAHEVQEALGDLEVECLLNRNYRDGMLSSVQCAVRHIDKKSDYLICLGDQPALARGTVHAVIDCAQRVSAGIVMPTFNGKRGHPLFLRRSYASAILSLDQGVGLNSLTRSHPEDTVEVPLDSPEILEDMDTPQDYMREINRVIKD